LMCWEQRPSLYFHLQRLAHVPLLVNSNWEPCRLRKGRETILCKSLTTLTVEWLRTLTLIKLVSLFILCV
jgi:hypothetical protein